MTITAADAEKILTDIWEELLETPVGPDDDFFDIGGYSLLVVTVVDRAREAGLGLAALDVFERPTVAALARHVAAPADTAGSAGSPDRGPDAPASDPSAARYADIVAEVWRNSVSPLSPDAPSTVVPLVADGTRPPLFCLYQGQGHAANFAAAARAVHGGRPVYAVESLGYRAHVRPLMSVRETAAHHLGQIRRIQPDGPYHLTGLCAGAVIALEMAQQIKASGGEIGALVLVDLPFGMPEFDPGWGVTEHYEYLIGVLRTRFGLHDRVADLPAVLAELKRRAWFQETDSVEDFHRLTVLWAAVQFAQEHYEPEPYEGPVTIVTPRDYEAGTRAHWSDLLPAAEYSLTEDVRMMRLCVEPPTLEAFRRALGS